MDGTLNRLLGGYEFIWEEMTRNKFMKPCADPCRVCPKPLRKGCNLVFFPPCTKEVMPLKETYIETSDFASS